MRILYLIHQFFPKYYTGTERVIFSTAAYLQKLGHQVSVLTYSHDKDKTFNYSRDEILYKKYVFEGVNVLAFKSNAIEYTSGNFIESQSEVYEVLIKEINPDIVHVGHLMYTHAFLQAAIRLKIPYVLSLTDFWLICHKAQLLVDGGALCSGPDRGKQCKQMCMGLKKKYYEPRFKKAETVLLNSKANIVSSQFLKNMFSQVVEGFHSVFVPYGLNFSYLGVNNKKYDKDSTINFLYSGTLSQHKGIDVALKAVEKISKTNYRLNVYGDGPLKPMVEAAAKNHENINFFGSYTKEDTKKLIKQNDVVLVPSAWYENNPIILQEMIAANIPPIVSNIGSLPEMAEDGKTGFVFEMSSINALNSVVENILESPTILNQIKSNMYKSYKIITLEQQCLAYLQIYNNILRENL